MSPSKRDTPDDAGAAVDLATRLELELHGLDGELAEIEMLVNQAKSEAIRHEQKRAQAADRLAAGGSMPPEDLSPPAS